MTRETYTKAAKLMAQMSVRKGVITNLTLKASNPKYILQKDEIEKKLLESMAMLSNLKKEFSEL